jgi:putative glutamine amidotransferase
MINGKPVICITSGSDYIREKGKLPKHYEQTEDYPVALANAGFVPFLAVEQNAEEIAMMCDAVCMSGGPDLEPEYYGETTLYESVKCDPSRSVYEYELLKHFIGAKKPILAVCRGFQVLNCYLGGTLYQDTAEQLGFIHMSFPLRHYVNAEKGSVLNALFGDRFKVNSTHHQAVKDLGKGLFVTARSEEGIIEAYEHESLPILGTQFHPERLTGKNYDGTTANFAPLFEYFYRMTMNNIKE